MKSPEPLLLKLVTVASSTIMLSSNSIQDYLGLALDALRSDDDGFRPALDALPVPVYVTDGNGLVTYWNRACVEFAGREPELGRDRWCVTWQLHTMDDEPLPHDRCPMAVAIKEQREVRGEIAIAMRPDGSRRAFVPYATPLFDEDGALKGAVNLLVDVTEEQAITLSVQAKRCQRLATAINDRHTGELLRGMAKGYERNADALRRA
jgi:PAS domain S-box-containing protein